jgi:hypothetical protein
MRMRGRRLELGWVVGRVGFGGQAGRQAGAGMSATARSGLNPVPVGPSSFASLTWWRPRPWGCWASKSR